MASFNLQAEMRKLSEPPANGRPPLWDYWRHDLWQRAQEDDPHRFMAWPCIYHTMLQDHWRDSIRVEADYLYANVDVPAILPQIILKDSKHPLSSWYNLIHQTYHLLRWQDATGLRIADMRSIYEFGGGYGAMALVCHRLGFRGQYYIYDLPEFALLQRWYLEQSGVAGVEWVGDKHYGHTDLFIACYSLSETDFDERDWILEANGADSYLFLYSNKFEDYDNLEYFRGLEYGEWMVSNWRHERIEHLPPESWYTWGW